jgi:hypothetical protein
LQALQPRAIPILNRPGPHFGYLSTRKFPRHRLFEERQDRGKNRAGLTTFDPDRLRRLRQLLSSGCDDQWSVGVPRARQSECFLQQYLAACTCYQIATPDDIGYAL